jgi:shikimate dehydrogenase
MRLYGLIGKPLTHSFSKAFFTDKFERENIPDCSYENFELDDISKLADLLGNNDLRGLNVTIPYKEKVIPFLHDKNEVVEETGACNCIRIENGVLKGYNTDVTGFQRSLEPKLKSHHKSALILGTGGAAKAIQYSLEKLGISYTLVSRRQTEGGLGYEDVDEEVLKEHLLIINTTPLGMYPNVDNDPSIPYEYLTPSHLLFDLIYNPAKTKFLKKGEEMGADILNGQDMLVIQAEESWRIWNS